MKWLLMIPTKPQFDSSVKRVLSRPEYSHLRNGLRDLIEKIRERIGQLFEELLKRTFSNLPSTASVSNKLSTIFMIIGILVILAIIIILAVKISKTFERRTRVREILGEKIDERTTPNSLRQKAAFFQKEGDFRQSIRYDFIALLLLMHEKNLLYLDETKTNYEIYNYLKKSGFSMLSPFQYLTDIFNSSWYGHKACSESMHENWSSNIDVLWNGVINYANKSK